jgi:hypothetical protein
MRVRKAMLRFRAGSSFGWVHPSGSAVRRAEEGAVRATSALAANQRSFLRHALRRCDIGGGHAVTSGPRAFLPTTLGLRLTGGPLFPTAIRRVLRRIGALLYRVVSAPYSSGERMFSLTNNLGLCQPAEAHFVYQHAHICASSETLTTPLISYNAVTASEDQ